MLDIDTLFGLVGQSPLAAAFLNGLLTGVFVLLICSFVQEIVTKQRTRLSLYIAMLIVPIVCFTTYTSALSGGCDRSPKEGFVESDLIGTWGGDIETAWDSLIVINRDGRYKQIINIKRTGFKYESDWRPWWVTYSEKGLPYLHLAGLLMCAYWEQIDCSTGQTGMEPFTPGGTKDPFGDIGYWNDFCQNKWVSTPPGEGIFMVFDFKLALRGIELVPFTKSPDTPTGPNYLLHEP